MANQPSIVASVKITALDVNNNHTTKQFNAVFEVNFDYNKGMLRITDATGQFYFSLNAVIAFTNVIAGGLANFHTITIT